MLGWLSVRVFVFFCVAPTKRGSASPAVVFCMFVCVVECLCVCLLVYVYVCCLCSVRLVVCLFVRLLVYVTPTKWGPPLPLLLFDCLCASSIVC